MQDDEHYQDPHTTAVVQEQEEEGAESSDHYDMSEHEEDEGVKIGDGKPNNVKDSTFEDSGNESSDE